MTEYLKNTFNISNDTSVTLVITLLVFILGYLLNGIGRSFSSFINRRNYRKTFNSMIEAIISSTKKQVAHFEEVQDIFRIENYSDFVLKRATLTHLDNVDKIDFKVLFESYNYGIENLFIKLRLKAFNKIFANLSLLKDLEYRYPGQLEKFLSTYHEHEVKWNESLEQMRQFSDNLTSLVNGQHVSMPIAKYCQQMDQILLAWQNNPERQKPNIVLTQLIQPLIQLNTQNGALQVTLPYNNILLNAEHHFDNMSKTISFYREVFLGYAKTYRKIYKVLIVCIKRWK